MLKDKTDTEYYIYNGIGLDILADYKYQTKQYGRYGVKGEPNGVSEYYYGNGLLLASKSLNDPQRGHWDWDRDPLRDLSFYHQDVLGSVVLLTDRNGQVEERYQYVIWGKAYDGKFADGLPGYGQKGNVYGFTGQRYQAELGVYSFPYRDYSPRTMRWLTVDPIKDGSNWYLYCENDPINLVDPFGLSTSEAIIQWGESVSGAGFWGKALGGLAILIGTYVLYNETQKSKENDTSKERSVGEKWKDKQENPDNWDKTQEKTEPGKQKDTTSYEREYTNEKLVKKCMNMK